MVGKNSANLFCDESRVSVVADLVFGIMPFIRVCAPVIKALYPGAWWENVGEDNMVGYVPIEEGVSPYTARRLVIGDGLSGYLQLIIGNPQNDHCVYIPINFTSGALECDFPVLLLNPPMVDRWAVFLGHYEVAKYLLKEELEELRKSNLRVQYNLQRKNLSVKSQITGRVEFGYTSGCKLELSVMFNFLRELIITL